MKEQKFKKVISVILCFAVVFAMAPGMTFKAEAANKTFNYVSLGDSTTNGYGMEGYTDAVRGFLQEAPDAYPVLIKKELEKTYGEGNVNLAQLAGSALRPDDLDAILDENHINGDYTERTFLKHNDTSGGEEWFKTWANQIPGVNVSTCAEGEKELRTYFTDKIKNADLITYYLGQNSMGIFLTSLLLSPSRWGDSDTSADLLARIGDDAAKYDVEALKSRVDKGLKTIMSEDMPTYSYIEDLVVHAYIGLTYYFDKNIEKMTELNPDCDIVVVGLNNNIGSFKAEVGGEIIDFRPVYDKLINWANTYMKELSPYRDKYEYADLQASNSDIETFYQNMVKGTPNAILQNELDSYVASMVKSQLPEALQGNATAVVAAAREMVENDNYEKMGALGLLSSNEQAKAILDIGLTEAEVLQMGHVYYLKDDNIAKVTANILKKHKNAIADKAGVKVSELDAAITLIALSDTFEDYEAMLGLIAGTFSFAASDLKDGLNTIGQSLEQLAMVGRINGILLSCTRDNPYLVNATAMLAGQINIDTAKIGQEVAACAADATGNTKVSAETKGLINFDFMLRFPENRGIGSHPDDKGHLVMKNIIWKAFTPKKATIKTASLYEKPDQIKVTWGAVSNAVKYVVTATPASGTAKTVTVTGTTATLKSLKTGVKYTIKVQAVNAAGNKGAASAAKTVYTIKKMATPKVAKSGSKVKVSWSKATGVTGYQISKSTSKSGTSVVSTISKQSTVSKTLAVAKGKTYYYKVRAYKTVNGKKVYGQWSAVKSFKRS